MDKDLKEAIEEGIKADRLTGDKLKEILLSGPQHVTKGLQEWNYENGLVKTHYFMASSRQRRGL